MNLKTAYGPYFKIGAAISKHNLNTKSNMELLLSQFNSFTCENNMKPSFFLDEEKNLANPLKYDTASALTFENARPFLDFARSNHISMRGHTLVWHNQTPRWFFCRNYDEHAGLADRETMIARLENYIRGVLVFVKNEYPGIIYAWDVVNEAVDEGMLRKSMWTETIGVDYVEKAFEFARKYAEPGTELYYNDYETAQAWKRDFIITNILEPLKERGLVDGMGMQSHLLMNHPCLTDYRTALEMYGALGLKINVTELDIHNNNPGDESMQALAKRYKELFEMLLNVKKSGQADITSVTFWNLLDENSWLTGFRRENSYPLLFWKECEPKPAYFAVLDATRII